MYTNNKLAKSIRLALMFGGTSLAMSGAAAAQDQSNDETQAEEAQERIQVTGSRIKRTDMEQDLPITVIDREAINLSGETSVADVIRGTTFNAAGSFRPQSGSSLQGASTVNLRGVGAGRSLVLIDGRRLPKSPLSGSVQDLNTIPIAAVERIEVLSDGASAVYGSDAIGGVINVVLRDDFNGAELRIGGASVSLPSDGGDREEGSAVFGASTSNARVMGGVSWNSRDIIFENAYEWNQPGTSIYGNNWTDALNAAQNAIVADYFEANPDDEDTTIRDLIPGYMPGFNAIPGACDIPNYRLVGNGQVIDDGDALTTCAYNFNATNANEASTGNKAIFVRGEYDINADWSVFMTANSAQTKSFGRYAPSLNDTNRVISPDSPNNPTNPDGWAYDPRTADADGNPAPRAVSYWHRFAALGNRDNNLTVTTNDFLVGATGLVGNVELDFGVRKNTSRSYNAGENYLLSSAARNYVNDGSYDLRDPLGTRFSDPDVAAAYEATYGRSYEDTLRGMNVTTSRRGKFDQEEAFFSAAFDVVEIGGGMIQAVVGADYRYEDYEDKYDSLSESGSVGGSSGSSAAGDRYVRSAFFETMFPITYDFEVSFAGRYDSYSDYGNDFSPKLSARWQATDNLVFRGSIGEGFRAPSLDVLTAQPALSADSIRDADTCVAFGQAADCAVQVQSTVIANPELGSEKSKQFAFGVAYQPVDWLSMTVDYFNIEIEDTITTMGAQTIINRSATGDPIPAAFSITRNPATNAIEGIVRGTVNEGTLETDGVDFNAVTNFDFGAMGALTQNFQVSWMNSYTIDGGRNFVGDQDLPEYRANLSNVYSWNDLTFAWNINHIASVDGPSGESGLVPSWTTHDMQIGYELSTGTSLTFGARNVFEKTPELIGFGGRNYNFNLYDAYGRITYFRFTQTF